jgi:hypothetical protein
VLKYRKFNSIDLTNVAYASDAMSKISEYIISSLEEAKVSISSMLIQVKESSDEKAKYVAQYKPKFESIRHVFYLTRLLQDYARIVGPDVDEGMILQFTY